MRVSVPVLALLVATLIVAVAANRADAYQPRTPMTAESACVRIHNDLQKLAIAEQNQALALELFAKGDSVPAVQMRLQELVARSSSLRQTLDNVRSSKISRSSKGATCLSIGDRALVKAQELSSDVEQVLYDRNRSAPLSKTATPGVAAPDK